MEPSPNSIKRQTAIKIRLADLKEGKYVKVNGEWDPNYVLTPFNTKVSRVNIIGTVLSLEDNDKKSFVIDDGTAQMTVRSFEELKQEILVSETYIIVGKVREFSNELYITPEITKQIAADPETKEAWLKLRQLELDSIYKNLDRIEIKKEAPVESKPVQVTTPTNNAPVEEEKPLEAADETVSEKPVENETPNDSKNPFDLVLEKIKELDSGNGVDIEDLIEATKLSETEIENITNNLLIDGEAFEIKPGKLKLLD